jgi:hypothetical protein
MMAANPRRKKQNEMKLSIRCAHLLHGLAIAGVIALSLSGATAGNLPVPGFRYHIRSRQQMEQLPVGAKIALVCAKCKTAKIAEVDANRRFLSWFTPGSKHKCPGCRGQFQNFTGARGTRGYFMHTCSLCGDVPLACSSNSPGHKHR